jgi:hypothetical protein
MPIPHLFRPIRHLAAASLLALLPVPAAQAEPIPLPTVDFEARGKFISGGELLLRHSGGKSKIEMQLPGPGVAITGIVDLKRKKITFTVPIPGQANTVVETDLSDEAAFGQVAGNGERIGNSVVAGEACTLWRIKSEHGSAVACLSKDNIPLKTEATVDGKTQVVFEVTELKRVPQSPAEFELPAGAKVIKLPKGFKGVPGVPGLN